MAGKIVSAARLDGGMIAARVSPTRYAFASKSGPTGSFSNRTGERRCVHMPEAEAMRLIERAGDLWQVKATGAAGMGFRSRIVALGVAVLHAREESRPAA